ncbi:hypothetical protein PAXRUDRAFT_131433 [Paxillus rubicundulus Ve08.2h10]|uniref:Unplaced genomic scaffold scaffold_29, whole genome shotgun sequence n=1 Tax=Paxillus rubicundulus Ve08.2h10 TaxID=930991 RepID=A0A0D0DM22_9AGAM|nr:hypothetical protein PAXRUDRAFT_131433 [Paxillus rubicundulus Ve08.2h10]
MSAVSHGTRNLRQGIGIQYKHALAPPSTSRSIHSPAFILHQTPPGPPSTAQRIFSQTRTFFSRFASHLTAPGLTHSSITPPVHASQSLLRPVHHHSSAQSIKAGFSLPVKHALFRPLAAPRLPKPPTVSSNVTHVGLGTARAFHSARPIFQNMVDNVPIAARALWEAEWDVKKKKKAARKMRRASENKVVTLKSQEMLKPKPQSVVAETQSAQADASELEVYFPLEPTPSVATRILVPLAPTPTARLPLSSRTAGGTAHPLLPIPELASIHYSHHLHSLRVSTLFARLDAANVWDDPGVNVDAYAYGLRDVDHGTREKQCTVLRVTFSGWTAARVRAVVGGSAEQWCSLEETHLDDDPPDSVSGPDTKQYGDSIEVEITPPNLPLLLRADVDSTPASELELDEISDEGTWDYGLGLSQSPTTAGASAQHESIVPEVVHPQPEMFLRTVSELARDAPADGWSLVSSPSSLSLSESDEFPFTQGSEMRAMETPWDGPSIGLSWSFVQRIGESELNGW